MNAWLETEAGDCLPVQGTCSFGRDAANTVVLPGNHVRFRGHAHRLRVLRASAWVGFPRGGPNYGCVATVSDGVRNEFDACRHAP